MPATVSMQRAPREMAGGAIEVRDSVAAQTAIMNAAQLMIDEVARAEDA
jgi:hypothetical protein